MVKQLRAARTRQALVLAAAEIFATDGYALSSLPAISRRAGVSAGALHFHFPSKEALAGEVESAARRAVEQLVADRRPSTASALDLLVTVVREVLAAVAADVVVRAGFKLSVDPSRKNGMGFGCWWRAWVCEELLRAQRAGELADGVSPDRVAAVIVAATLGFEVLGSEERDRIPARHVEQFWSLVLPQLAAHGDQFASIALPGSSAPRPRANSMPTGRSSV
ncbi:ScbR family autoregulator-binding transcription factor [Streptomyces sp. NPDC001833]|uniref:ScbR family autoregulator-binding transcription factor n=1 Tax=Streptomyces sp. NPDC001833 TaxID=3154658 RepID=UPI00331927DB